jgi:hypothetical protein
MHVNAKMIPVGTIPGIGGGELRLAVEGVNSSVVYLIHCKNPCKCHNIPPTHHSNKEEKKDAI